MIKEHPLEYKFHRAYANLPLDERSMPIVIIEGEPLSWRVVRSELLARTKRGRASVEQLENLGILTQKKRRREGDYS